MKTLLKLIFLVTLAVGFVACDSVSLPTDDPSPTNPTDPTPDPEPEPEPTPDKSNPSDAEVVEALPSKPEVTENGYAWENAEEFNAFWAEFQKLNRSQIIIFSQALPLKTRTLLEKSEDPTEEDLKAAIEDQGLKEGDEIGELIPALDDTFILSLLDEEGRLKIGSNIIIFTNEAVYQIPEDQIKLVDPLKTLTPELAEENGFEFILSSKLWEEGANPALSTQQITIRRCRSGTFNVNGTTFRVKGNTSIYRVNFFGLRFNRASSSTTFQRRRSFLGVRYWQRTNADTIRLVGPVNVTSGSGGGPFNVIDSNEDRIVQFLNINVASTITGNFSITHSATESGQNESCLTTGGFNFN